jgi:CheY-like chemotaxis protein
LTFPLIFLTGSWDDTPRTQAMDCGCVAYLHKSSLADRLIEAVEKATGSNSQ